jgi:hypothetical protein
LVLQGFFLPAGCLRGKPGVEKALEGRWLLQAVSHHETGASQAWFLWSVPRVNLKQKPDSRGCNFQIQKCSHAYPLSVEFRKYLFFATYLIYVHFQYGVKNEHAIMLINIGTI